MLNAEQVKAMSAMIDVADQFDDELRELKREGMRAEQEFSTNMSKMSAQIGYSVKVQQGTSKSAVKNVRAFYAVKAEVDPTVDADASFAEWLDIRAEQMDLPIVRKSVKPATPTPPTTGGTKPGLGYIPKPGKCKRWQWDKMSPEERAAYNKGGSK